MTAADKEPSDNDRPSFEVGAFRGEVFTRRTRLELVEAIRQAVKLRKLTQQDAAILCATSQSSLGRLLLGDDRKVSIERMMRWLIELGGSVEICIAPHEQGVKTWHLAVARFMQDEVRDRLAGRGQTSQIRPDANQ